MTEFFFNGIKKNEKSKIIISQVEKKNCHEPVTEKTY